MHVVVINRVCAKYEAQDPVIGRETGNRHGKLLRSKELEALKKSDRFVRPITKDLRAQPIDLNIVLHRLSTTMDVVTSVSRTSVALC
jgi:hypothetical protein